MEEELDKKIDKLELYKSQAEKDMETAINMTKMSGIEQIIRNIDTDLFYISRERWRIDWEKYGMMDRDYSMGPTLMIGSDDTTEIPLLIYESSEYGHRESDTRYVYEEENYFRLSITSFNVIDWTIEIYEGIKCE